MAVDADHADLEPLLRDTGVTRESLTRALRRLLDRPEAGALSITDAENIDRFGGVAPSRLDEATAARADRRAGEAVADAARDTDALTTSEVAARLGKDPSRISHMKSAGDLYALPGRTRNVFPGWQIVVDPSTGRERPVPHLASVLEVLPQPIHPATLERFFTVPQDLYVVNGAAVSAAEWLNGGGDPQVVLHAAESMHALG